MTTQQTEHDHSSEIPQGQPGSPPRPARILVCPPKPKKIKRTGVALHIVRGNYSFNINGVPLWDLCKHTY